MAEPVTLESMAIQLARDIDCNDYPAALEELDAIAEMNRSKGMALMGLLMVHLQAMSISPDPLINALKRSQGQNSV